MGAIIYIFRYHLCISEHFKFKLEPHRQTLQDLEAKRRRARTVNEKKALLNLPATLATLEVKIQQIAEELGSQKFRELTGTSGKNFNI